MSDKDKGDCKHCSAPYKYCQGLKRVIRGQCCALCDHPEID